MAVGVESVRAFAEHPFGALELFAEREVVRGDVLVGAGDALLSDGKLAHQGEAEVVLLAAEVDGEEAAAESFGGFPADLAAQTGFVAGGGGVRQVQHEREKNGFDKVPIIGAAGEEGAQPEVGPAAFIDVDDGEVALAAGGHVEADGIFAAVSVNEFGETGDEHPRDLLFTFPGTVGQVGLKLGADLVSLEVDALKGIIEATLLDDGPIDNRGRARGGIAEIGLPIVECKCTAGVTLKLTPLNGLKWLNEEGGRLAKLSAWASHLNPPARPLHWRNMNVTNQLSEEEMKQELARLRAENTALKQTSAKGLSMKISEKGGLSIYGLGRFPVTLYKEQWKKLLDLKEDIMAFLEANDAQLKTKETKE